MLAEINRASNSPGSCADPGKSNPVHPLRGIKREELDTGLGIGGTTLKLTYDSSALVSQVFVGTAYTQEAASGGGVSRSLSRALLGHGWSANLLDRMLASSSVRQGTGTNPGGAAVSRGDGRSVTLSRDAAGQYTPEANVADRLVALAGGAHRYHDARANVLESYDAAGRLTAMAWAAGGSLSLTYSDANTPASVASGAGYVIGATDDKGRSLSFTYVAPTGPVLSNHLLKTVSDAAGQTMTLNYDGANRLSSIVWADGKARTFLYETSDTSWALTGIVDENNTRYATFGYDQGRAISSEHAGGVDRVSVTYTTPPSIQVSEQYDAAADAIYRYYDWALPQGIVVTEPTGAANSWSATSLLNKNHFTGQSQPAGSGCSASANAITYDANGNVASEDDFNGKRVCRVSDLSRNLETVRVEGLSNTQACSAVTSAGATLPAGSRKVSTEWHPDWRLSKRVAEPGRITTSVYNGQPDPFNANATASCAPSTALLPDGKPIVVLCRQVEQATTDADGSQGFAASLQAGVASREQKWTYNQWGQVLTHDGPRTDVTDVTTNTYYSDTAFTGADPNAVGHTIGDLQSVTDATGKVTQYTQYDKHGNVLEKVDPNEVVTTYTYDLRQRLLSVSVGGQTTSYTYDPVGQLTRVTQPDASWVGYEYDDAHRRKAALDSQGNRIEYTLDNAGNVTAQNVKDPGGALRRTLARSTDALGRLQQTTGRN